MADKKRPVGRPSKYKPEYCEALIKHMAKGLSFETFGATIGASRAVLYQWEEKHPEFLDAKKEGFEQNQLFWEQAGLQGMMGEIQNFNATVFVFNMKNRFNWTDKRETTSTIEANVKQESALSKEVVDELRDLLKTGVSERKQS